VGGLQAQSFSLQNISGNIANSSTIGYQGINTSFEDLVPDATSPSRQVAGGVTAYAQQTITTAGNRLRDDRRNQHGDQRRWFFDVQKPTSTVDQYAGLQRGTDYTRRGDFQSQCNGT